nr:MAG TPA: hypothetical protein [Bacteriophage sp.]
MQRINRIKASDLWRKDNISLGLFLYIDLFSTYGKTTVKNMTALKRYPIRLKRWLSL